MDILNKQRWECIWLVMVIGVLQLEVESHSSCGQLKRTVGYTVPLGDITLEHGEPLNITCNLYESEVVKNGPNASSQLYFTRNNQPVSKEMIEILNSTSIRLYIANHPLTREDNYVCSFNESSEKQRVMACLNVVIVGVAPKPVTDFACISRNYDNLTCTWTPPENFVKTDYNLTYTLKGRAGRYKQRNFTRLSLVWVNQVKKIKFLCPEIMRSTVNHQLACFYNVSTSPQYRQAHAIFYFTLHMNNTFGNATQDYTFEHFKHVLPNPPEHLKVLGVSSHSINLTWNIPSSMVGFPKKLQHRILYQCEYDKRWHSSKSITEETAKRERVVKYELKNLMYAHALYDIRVSIRSEEADPNDESMWSGNATRTVRTRSKIPDCPPETNIGSFEILNNGTRRVAYVYWKQIKEEQKNGENFNYSVLVENYPSLQPVELTKAFAKFHNLDPLNYTVNIWSKNENGTSLEKSTVVIPAQRLSEPLNVFKIEHREELYELSWERPNSLNITNYTIFWCSNEKDRPHQCMGNLNWTTVSNETQRYNQTLPKNHNYQFAISANSDSSSSGMSWAECTIIQNRLLGKMRHVWIKEVGSDYIDVGWKMDCSDGIDIVKGFIIYYCPVKSSDENMCTEEQKTVKIIGDKKLLGGRVNNLKPYTTYQLSVGVSINHSTTSRSSDMMFNTTLEAAPSDSPVDVTIYNITNSSLSIKWAPPYIINGIIKYYVVHYNNNQVKVDPGKMNITNITLLNLTSFVNYSISVEACTIACSKRSQTQVVTTKMWLPGQIKKPYVVAFENEWITIAWDKPNPPRGLINYYQLKFMEKLDDEYSTEPTVNVSNGQSYNIESCSDSVKDTYFFVSVRAVNIIDGQHKYGPWSDAFEAKCQEYKFLIYLFIGFICVLVFLGLFVLIKKIYVIYINMQNVEVKLPPGLAPAVERDLVPWGSEKHPEDIDQHPRADEELLLDKISDLRLSGDSSGCSSGHESITCSLESATHMSNSDSGTEQLSSLTDENMRNSLRQRNVTSKGYLMPEAVPTTINWVGAKPSTIPASNYCVLGVDSSSPQSESIITPYVPLTDITTNMSLPYMSNTLSSPTSSYVMTGDFVKTTNPGYVPYAPNEPVVTPEMNKGYVVPVMTKDLLVPDLLHSKEDKPLYIKAAEHSSNKQFTWQQSQQDSTLPKSGYVSVGDASPPRTAMEVTKGYVPHRQFEVKTLKED